MNGDIQWMVWRNCETEQLDQKAIQWDIKVSGVIYKKVSPEGEGGEETWGLQQLGRLLPIHLEVPSVTSPNLKTNSTHSSDLTT
jgi:hypothetical protein